ncbi:MAG: mechanosensitive ion channel family protein [Candidatus Limnocylindrales bacterium]
MTLRVQSLPGYELVAGPHAVVGDLLVLLLVTLAALWLARRLVRGAVAALVNREATEGTAQELSAIELRKRSDTLQGLADGLARALILMVAFVMALDKFGLNIGPAVAGLGIAGLALGLGAQSLVRDYLAGTFILIENHYSKGDVVKIADVTGTVEDFTLRRTTLRDMDGTVHIVPNGLISVTSNMTRVWGRINVDVTVVYGSDIDRVIEVVNELGRSMAEAPEWKRRILEAPQVARVEALGETGVTLKILGTVRAADRWAAAGELRKRVLDAFKANRIEMPLVQRMSAAPSGPSTPSGAPTDEDLAAGSD